MTSGRSTLSLRTLHTCGLDSLDVLHLELLLDLGTAARVPQGRSASPTRSLATPLVMLDLRVMQRCSTTTEGDALPEGYKVTHDFPTLSIYPLRIAAIPGIGTEGRTRGHPDRHQPPEPLPSWDRHPHDPH